MFTQVSCGQFLEPLFRQARNRCGIDFEDQYPNLAVYTTQAVGLWGYEIVGAFSVRLFRWLTNIPDQVIRGPYENPDKSPQEFRIRFEREFWRRARHLKTYRMSIDGELISSSKNSAARLNTQNAGLYSRFFLARARAIFSEIIASAC